MSAIATPYVGFDVSNRTLQCAGPCLQSTGKVRNQAEPLVRELQRLRALYPALHLVCEPTGGCERLLLATAHALQIPITLVDAWKVRHFALGLGWLEKSDPIDAALLRRYALTAAVAPTPGCGTGCSCANTTSNAWPRKRPSARRSATRSARPGCNKN